jgi:hypothetical protein
MKGVPVGEMRQDVRALTLRQMLALGKEGSFRASGASRGICRRGSFRAKSRNLHFTLFLITACRSESKPAPVDTTPVVVSTPAPTPPGIPPVFAADQAKAGQKVYFAECVRCHTADRFIGEKFTSIWNSRRVYDLYDIVSSTMPQDIPGSLTQQQYLDVVAFMLQINGAKPGKEKLSSDVDAMKKMRIGVTRPTE